MIRLPSHTVGQQPHDSNFGCLSKQDWSFHGHRAAFWGDSRSDICRATSVHLRLLIQAQLSSLGKNCPFVSVHGDVWDVSCLFHTDSVHFSLLSATNFPLDLYMPPFINIIEHTLTCRKTLHYFQFGAICKEVFMDICM